MKEISQEEARKLLKKEGRSTPVRSRVQAMQVGECLIIERQDWKQKNSPRQMVTQLAKKDGTRYDLHHLVQGGWLVERTG